MSLVSSIAKTACASRNDCYVSRKSKANSACEKSVDSENSIDESTRPLLGPSYGLLFFETLFNQIFFAVNFDHFDLSRSAHSHRNSG